jgi:RimJ/RimL family protein N-acetyltransferase
MVKVRSHETVEEFWSLAGPLLSADPVRHTIAVAIVGRLTQGIPFSDEPPIFVTVHADTVRANDGAVTGGAVTGAAMCTPPRSFIVSALPPEAAPAVADHLRTLGVSLTGVTGGRDEAEAFGAAWAERTGLRMVVRLDQRLYRLGELSAPTTVPGHAGPPVTDDEYEQVARWRAAFAAESMHCMHGSPDIHANRAEVRRIRAAGSSMLLWRVDGTPVSYAGVGRPQQGMSRVGPVYTPPEHRGHGYGSAVTAAASRLALDQGAEHVVLFTDVANPVSNSIYQRIGFRPVGDALDAAFEPGGLP